MAPIWKLMATTALVWFAELAVAQTADPAEARGDRLEEIVVTARKRQETAQTVPIAIQTISATALEQQNIIDLTDIGGLLPNVNVEPSPGTGTAAAVSLRGISTYDFELYVDPPIAVYVDGVIYARPQMMSLNNLIDLERIEVLYGPQGTLFGRNTTGGAINITTKLPSEEASARVRAGYGSYAAFDARTVINTGRFGKIFRAKFVYDHHQVSGYQRNLYTDRAHSPGASNSEYFAATLMADLSPKVDFIYRFDRTETKYRVGGSQTVDATPDVLAYFGSSPLYGGAPFLVSKDYLKEFYQATAFPASRAKIDGHSATLTYKVSDALTLKNILSYRRMRIDERNSGGGQGFMRGFVLDPITFAPAGVADVIPFFTPRLNDRVRDITNELQATGTVGDFDFAAGLFYFDERSRGDNINQYTFVLAGGAAGLNLSTRRLYALSTRSYAGYGQLSWRPSALDGRLEATAGVRYTEDHKRLSEELFSLGAPTGAQRLRDSWNDVSENFSLSYRVAEDSMIYGRIGTGYKAGGYNPGTLQGAYGPEKATVYEFGLKSEVFDRRLRLNATIFRTVYDKLQIGLLEITPTSNSTVITNAAAVRLTGFEASFVALPARGLQLEGSVGYVDPHYTRFDYRDPVTLELLDLANEARSPLTSKWTYSAAVQQGMEIESVGRAIIRLDYSYRSPRYYFALDRQNARNEIVRGNARHELRASAGLAEVRVGSETRLKIDLWGDNLLNQHRRIGGIDFGGLGFGTVAYDRPRSFGSAITVDF